MRHDFFFPNPNPKPAFLRTTLLPVFLGVFAFEPGVLEDAEEGLDRGEARLCLFSLIRVLVGLLTPEGELTAPRRSAKVEVLRFACSSARRAPARPGDGLPKDSLC